MMGGETRAIDVGLSDWINFLKTEKSKIIIFRVDIIIIKLVA